jgi:hypothetical protein
MFCAIRDAALFVIAYHNSQKAGGALPPGALPYVAGSVMPLLAVIAPFILYLRSVENKRVEKLRAEAIL